MTGTVRHNAAQALAVALLFLMTTAAFASGKRIAWKAVNQALLKLNNHPVKTWGVYQPVKNHNLVLVEIDRRLLVIDTKERRVYTAQRSDFEAHGDDLLGPVPDEHTPVLTTDSWDMHDVGPAEQISFRLTDNGDAIDLQLPHPINPY